MEEDFENLVFDGTSLVPISQASRGGNTGLASRPMQSIQPKFNSLAATLGPDFEKNFGPNSGGGGNGFDFKGALSNFSLGAQGISGLLSAYSAFKQTGFMKDQLNLQRGAFNRNIKNQATTANTDINIRADGIAQTYGPKGSLAYNEKFNELNNQVDGSAIQA